MHLSIKTNQPIIQNSAPSPVLNGREQCTIPVSLRGAPSSVRALCVQREGTVYCTCKLERGYILCTGPCVFRGREQCTVPVSLRGATSSVQDLVCSGGGYSILYL